MNPTISIIIPNYNDPRINRTLNSIINQTTDDYEIIIIEGCVKNTNTNSIYKKYQSKISHLIHEADKGIFDALNKGINMAVGSLIFLIGSDDYLSDSGVFYSIITIYKQNRTLDGICIGCEFVNSKGKVIRRWYPSSVNASKIKWGLSPPHFSLFLKKNIYYSVGDFKFEELGNVACDIFWLLDLAILFPKLKIEVVPEHNVFMQYGGASTGSLSKVFKQFMAVHYYARKQRKHLPLWFLLSPIRTISKISQFRFNI